MTKDIDIKSYAPVIIPTLCRYVHFKRCIESLSKCTYARYTKVYIGLDYPSKEEHWDGYNKIVDYLSSCGDLGFKKIVLIKREKNYGAQHNINSLKKIVFSKYKRLIVSEDDNEFSPAFLDFMNKALTKYEKNEKISSVCGYSFPRYKGYKKYDSYYTCICSAWGMGLWKKKELEMYKKNAKKDYILTQFLLWKTFWKCYKVYPYIIIYLMSMLNKQTIWGDVSRAFLNIENHTFQIRPSSTLVRNWGDDGSGVHCGNKNTNCRQSLTQDKFWTIKKTATESFFLTRYYQFTDFFSNNAIKTIIKIFILLPYKYVKFRNNHKR